MHNVKLKTAGILSSLLAVFCPLSAVDLSPYYSNMVTDGFTATFEGTATSGGTTYLAEWAHVFEVVSEENGVTQTTENVYISFGGELSNTVRNFYEVTDEGVYYLGNEASVSALGFTITTTLTVDGDSVFLPNEIEVPGELEWNAVYETASDFGFGFPTVETEEENMRLEFVGFESVTVPVGTYEALKVMNYDLPGDGAATLVGTTWYAPGLGMIKGSFLETEDGQTITYDIEMTSLRAIVPGDPFFPFKNGATSFDDIYFQDWIGYFVEVDTNLIYHYGLGYLYLLDLNEDGAGWLYSLIPELSYIYVDSAWLSVPGADQDPPVGDFTGWIYSLDYAGGWMYVYVTLSGDIYVLEEGEWKLFS